MCRLRYEVKHSSSLHIFGYHAIVICYVMSYHMSCHVMQHDRGYAHTSTLSSHHISVMLPSWLTTLWTLEVAYIFLPSTCVTSLLEDLTVIRWGLGVTGRGMISKEENILEESSSAAEESDLFVHHNEKNDVINNQTHNCWKNGVSRQLGCTTLKEQCLGHHDDVFDNVPIYWWVG